MQRSLRGILYNVFMKAFALLEFLVFIAVVGVVIVGILGNLKQNFIKNANNSNYFDVENVTFCNEIAPHCILDSNIPSLTPFFELEIKAF